MKKIETYINKNKQQFLAELNELLSIKSVSTDPLFKSEIIKCASFLKDHLEQIGMQNTKIVTTKGHPIVYSEYVVSQNLPTILLYGHYDVQPADPYELWKSEPFKARIENDYIYARGVSDDKGQFFSHIKAIQAFLEVNKTLPVNIKMIIEGEEEIGSQNLPIFLNENKQTLSADVAVISDTPMLNKNQPALCFSLRGMVYVELIVNGPNRDLHSGQYGGIVSNPIQALATMLSKLKDDQDNILIPGFYDDIEELTENEKNALKHTSLSLDVYKKDLGVSDFVKDNIDISKQLWTQPTLDCNGIVGGYIKEGAKTIIPAQASAKISMRLVANQNPKKVLNQLKDYLNKIKPRGIDFKLNVYNLAKPAKMNTSSYYMNAASEAYKSTFNATPKLIGEGGTIPVVADFKDILNLDTVMMGFNCPDDCIHSPNERLLLNSFFTSIKTMAHFFNNVSKQ